MPLALEGQRAEGAVVLGVILDIQRRVVVIQQEVIALTRLKGGGGGAVPSARTTGLADLDSHGTFDLTINDVAMNTNIQTFFLINITFLLWN